MTTWYQGAAFADGSFIATLPTQDEQEEAVEWACGSGFVLDSVIPYSGYVNFIVPADKDLQALWKLGMGEGPSEPVQLYRLYVGSQPLAGVGPVHVVANHGNMVMKFNQAPKSVKRK